VLITVSAPQISLRKIATCCDPWDVVWNNISAGTSMPI
jgi:hypothetical protein